MPKQPDLTPAQKAALTRKSLAAAKVRSEAAKLVWKKRRNMDTWDKAHASEAASKEALKGYCLMHGWKVAFFEGKTGAPRTAIIDAVAFRIARGQADVLDLRLVQLKGGNAGVTGREIARLKKAAQTVVVSWLLAAFDGDDLHIVPDLLD